MKMTKEDAIYGGSAERIYITYKKKADFFIRKFEIRCEILTGAGIGLLFSDRYFKTYNLTPSYFIDFLKKIEKEVKKYENENRLFLRKC
jgi:hypothetical protein